MRRLTIIVIVAALAYAGYWFWNANLQKTAIERWFEDRRNAGRAADYSDLSVKGFPNRLDTTITTPRLGDPDSGLMWETPFFQLFRLTYNPKHLIAVAANEQTFATPTGEVGISTTDLRASLEMADLASWTPERLIIVAEGLATASTKGTALNADVIQLTAEQLGSNKYRMALDARGLTGAWPGLIESTGSNSTPINRLTADLELTLSSELNRETIERTRPQPQFITLKLAEAQWNGLNLAAAGELEVTSTGTPLGQITLKLRNWRDVIAKERQNSRLSSRAVDQIEFTLNLISGLSGNPETLDLPFDFTNNGIWLGPLKIAQPPRISIP